MGFEDLKYDFPKMPKEMRDMVEREVKKQVQAVHPHAGNAKKAAGRTLAASIAAAMLFGTTVFAGVSLYGMQRKQVGQHGIEVTITEHGKKDAGAKAAGSTDVKIPDVKLEAGYLPDGMVETEKGKYSFKNALHEGGVSVVFYRMDTGDSAFDMLHGDVRSSESLTLNGREGVYLEYPQLFADEITFNQRIYVAFTDVHYVMEMYAASDVPKEEAVKIAENIRLIPVESAGDGAMDKDLVQAWDWSSYLASLEENSEENLEESRGEQLMGVKTAVPKEEMGHTHAIGESFPANGAGTDGQDGLVLKVSNVQVSADLSLLTPSLVDERLQKETDGHGKLRPAEIAYRKDGGVDALSEIVKSRKVPQRLVYASVEYTNTGKQELTDVLFFGSLARIREENGQMQMVSEYETPPEPASALGPASDVASASSPDAWTRVVNRGLSGLFEMQYYDVHGGERGNNYIPSIKPGETVTVHMGWVVTEEELDKLYISLDTAGGAGVFTDTALALGYVDIRQGR